MKVALAQYALSSHIDGNIDKVIAMMEAAAHEGADLVTFPELSLTPFFPQYPARDASGYVMCQDGKATRQLRRRCRELKIAALPDRKSVV